MKQANNSSYTNGHSAVITSRLYSGEDDLRAMLAMLMQARSRTNDWHYAHVGELLFNFFMVTCHLDPFQYIRLWHDIRGNLIGYAILGEDPSFDFQLSPDYEWAGIEEEAFDWAATLLSDLRRRDFSHWGGQLGAGARQDDLRRIAFLEGRGF